MSNGNQQEALNGAPVPRSDAGSNIDRGMTAGKREKKVLITGGSRGIGAATVMRFVSEGYRTVFLYKEDKESADRLLKKLGCVNCENSDTAGDKSCVRLSGNHDCMAYRCDVSDLRQVIKFKEELRNAATRLATDATKEGAGAGDANDIDSGYEEDDITFDTIVCNAGIGLSGLFTDMTDDDWNRLRSINLDGTMNVLREFLPQLVSRKGGSVVLVSSMWGRVGASCEAGYSATKAAVIGLAKSLAKELGPSGIRVNCVAPGLIDTDMNSDLEDCDIKALVEETPLGRMGKPQEVAELIAFLASDKADFITGQVIGIDGGFVI